MTVTETGPMVVKPGLDVMDETTEAGQIMMGIWNPIIAAPGGPLRIFWGIEVENPNKLWSFIDWETIEDHERFASGLGQELTKDWPRIMASGEWMRHITVNPSPPRALHSAATEVMLAYFPSGISASTKDANSARFQKFLEKGLNACSDVQGVSYGWGVEKDFPVRDSKDGQQGTLFTALIGWPSIDAHMKFRETQAFKDNVHLLREMEEMVKLGMFHIQCKYLERK